MSKRKEIGRRVVGERVLGSSNVAARWGRGAKSTCWDSIGGFFVGILLFFITFSLPFCAARTEKDSKDIAQLDVITAQEAASFTGKTLVRGKLAPAEQLDVPMVTVDAPVLAYQYTMEKWETWTETKTETRTVTRDGQDVEITEEVTEEVSDWKVQNEDERWSKLSLDGMHIDPENARIDLEWENVFNDEYTDAATGEKFRENVEVIKGGMTVLWAAELENGRLAAKPDFNRVTPKTKQELVAQMHGEEEGQRWMLIIASVILWTIAFNLLIGPAFFLLNIIPVKQIGAAVRGIYTVVSLVMAVILTWVTYVAVRYWWLILLLLIALAVVIVVLANRRRQAEPDLDLEDEPLAD